MLVTFSCDAYEDITFLGDVAKQLLHLMGHSGTIPGAILADDVPEALRHLKKALSQRSGAVETKEEEEEPEVLLSQRAFPLIELLKHAAEKPCNVMWDYR